MTPKERQKIYNKRYREKNKLKIKLYQEKYNLKNKEQISWYKKEYRKNNREKLRKIAREYWKKDTPRKAKQKEKMRSYQWNKRIKELYNITEQDFLSLLKKQDNKCAICFTDKWGGHKNKPHIDHCHKTGKVRGLLCCACNLGMGMLKDSSKLLLNAVKYLKKNG